MTHHFTTTPPDYIRPTKLQDFIGKVVINTQSGERYLLDEITAPKIMVATEKLNRNGCRSHYSWETINGDPFTRGYLKFEDPSLTELFLTMYNAHCRSEDGRWENYGYWLMKD